MTFFALPMVLFLISNTLVAGASGEARAASTLAQEYETVFRGDSKLMLGSASYRGLPQQDSDALRVPFVYLRVSLQFLSPKASKDILGAVDAILVGAKDFRAPSGLGSVQSQFCYVLVLGDRQIRIDKYFNEAPIETFADSPIWKWKADLKEYGEEDPRLSVLFATQIGSSYIVISNSSDGIKAAVDSLQSPATNSSDATWSRDGKLVSGHNVWAFRHYRHVGDGNRDAAGMSDVPPGAEALLYFIDEAKMSSTLMLIGTSSDTSASIHLGRGTSSLPPLKPFLERKGCWETSFPLSGDSESNDRMLTVMGFFGFGIYA